MPRQILSIALALLVGYAGFRFVFTPAQAPPAHSAASADSSASVAASLAPPTPTFVPGPLPPRPSICQELRSGEFADGRPIGGQLWQGLLALHPECTGGTPLPAGAPSPGAPSP